MADSVGRMIERKTDGVAIMTSEMDRSLINQLASRKVPLVFLDVGKVRKGVCNIKVDYAQGITQAVDHLRGLGHSRTAFISGPGTLKSARVRRGGFLGCPGPRGPQPSRLGGKSKHQIEHRAGGPHTP